MVINLSPEFLNLEDNMAQPVKYNQTFVPTNFGAVGQLAGLYSQDVSRRNQMYNQAMASSMDALGQIGAIPTYDIEGRQQRLDAVGKAMDEAVSKKGGDYAAASRDLMRIIASERSNPWYQLNARQQQAAEDRRKLSMDADNMVVGMDPNQYSIQDAQKMLERGIDPFKQSALSREQLYRRAGDIAGTLAKSIMDPNSPDYNPILGGQYFEMITQNGVTPEGFEQFVTSGEGKKIMDSLLASYPELKGANELQAREVIKQGLMQAIGSPDIKQLANQNFMSDYERERLRLAGLAAKGSGSPLRKAGEVSLPFSRNLAMQSPTFNAQAVEAVKGTNLEGKVKSYADLVKASEELEPDQTPIAGGLSVSGSTNQILRRTPQASEALRILDNIESVQSQGMSIPTWNLDPLSTNDATEAGHIVKLQEVFNDRLKGKLNEERLKPVNKADEKALKKFDWDEDFSFAEIGYDANSGLEYMDANGNPSQTSGYGTGFVMKLVGVDKDGDPSQLMVMLPRTPENRNIEFSLAAWLRSFDQSFNDLYMQDATITWNK